jgi:predicted NACHT family NTPase
MFTEGSRDTKRVPYETFIRSRRQIHTNILNRKVVVKGQEGISTCGLAATMRSIRVSGEELSGVTTSVDKLVVECALQIAK